MENFSTNQLAIGKAHLETIKRESYSRSKVKNSVAIVATAALLVVLTVIVARDTQQPLILLKKQNVNTTSYVLL